MLAFPEVRITESPCIIVITPVGKIVAWLPGYVLMVNGEDIVEQPDEFLIVTE